MLQIKTPEKSLSPPNFKTSNMKNCISDILLNSVLAGSSPLPVGLLDRLGQSTAISQDPRIHLDGKNPQKDLTHLCYSTVTGKRNL